MESTNDGMGQASATAGGDGPTLTDIGGQMVASSVTMEQMFGKKGTPIDQSTGEKASTADEPTQAEKDIEEALSKSEKNDESKKERLSQKEWQDKTEKAKKAEILEKKDEESEEEKRSLRSEVESLKEVNARKDWELDHPVVRDDRYKESWAKVNSEPRFKELTYEERWALISREDASSVTKAIVQDHQRQQSSVPSASRGMPQTPQLDAETEEMGRFWKNSPEDFKKYGLI